VENSADENLPEEKIENHAKSLNANSLNVIVAQERTKKAANSIEQHISSEPKKTKTEAKPGSMISINQLSGSHSQKS